MVSRPGDREPRAARARGRPWTTRQWTCSTSRGRLSLVFLGRRILHHRAVLLRALVLALHLHPALALALVLAGAGMAAIGGGALAVTLAGIDTGALHGLAGILLRLSGKAVTGREHADDCRRNDESQSFLAVHPAVLLAG